MGQRLVMSVYEAVDAAEPFAAVYLHWSAYSLSALREAEFLLKRLNGKTCLTIFPHTSLDPTKVVRGSCGLRRMRSSNFCISGNHPNPSS